MNLGYASSFCPKTVGEAARPGAKPLFHIESEDRLKRRPATVCQLMRCDPAHMLIPDPVRTFAKRFIP